MHLYMFDKLRLAAKGQCCLIAGEYRCQGGQNTQDQQIVGPAVPIGPPADPPHQVDGETQR